jgi:hypothetical protein
VEFRVWLKRSDLSPSHVVANPVTAVGLAMKRPNSLFFSLVVGVLVGFALGLMVAKTWIRSGVPIAEASFTSYAIHLYRDLRLADRLRQDDIDGAKSLLERYIDDALISLYGAKEGGLLNEAETRAFEAAVSYRRQNPFRRVPRTPDAEIVERLVGEIVGGHTNNWRGVESHETGSQSSSYEQLTPRRSDAKPR